MNGSELSERICTVLSRTRQISGKSQAYMAQELKVSRSTVQNWEYGVSLPTLIELMKWFEVADVPYFPYLAYICDMGDSRLKPDATIDEKKKALIDMIDCLPDSVIDELLYMFNGTHGASVSGVLDGFTAYLHLPLKIRISIMQYIGTNFLLCQADGTLTNTDKAMPDTKVLHEFVKAGYDAYVNGKNNYV